MTIFVVPASKNHIEDARPLYDFYLRKSEKYDRYKYK